MMFYDSTSHGNFYTDYVNGFVWEVPRDHKCRLLSVNVLFDGTISSSCGHILDIKNIKTSKIEMNKILKCNGTICEGSAGINQREQSKDLNENTRDYTPTLI